MKAKAEAEAKAMLRPALPHPCAMLRLPFTLTCPPAQQPVAIQRRYYSNWAPGWVVGGKTGH